MKRQYGPPAMSVGDGKEEKDWRWLDTMYRMGTGTGKPVGSGYLTPENRGSIKRKAEKVREECDSQWALVQQVLSPKFGLNSAVREEIKGPLERAVVHVYEKRMKTAVSVTCMNEGCEKLVFPGEYENHKPGWVSCYHCPGTFKNR